MNNILKVKQTVPYDLRKRKVLQSRNPSSVRYDIEIWPLVLETITNFDSIKSFKQKIKKWKPDCPCSLLATCWLHLIIRYLVSLL